MLYVPSEHIWLPDIVLYNNWDGNYEVSNIVHYSIMIQYLLVCIKSIMKHIKTKTKKKRVNIFTFFIFIYVQHKTIFRLRPLYDAQSNSYSVTINISTDALNYPIQNF